MVRKLLTIAAAGTMALAPIAAQAAPIALGSDARAAAEMGDANSLRGSNAPVFIGLILVILLLAIVVSGNRDEPSNSP